MYTFIIFNDVWMTETNKYMNKIFLYTHAAMIHISAETSLTLEFIFISFYVLSVIP